MSKPKDNLLISNCVYIINTNINRGTVVKISKPINPVVNTLIIIIRLKLLLKTTVIQIGPVA